MSVSATLVPNPHSTSLSPPVSPSFNLFCSLISLVPLMQCGGPIISPSPRIPILLSPPSTPGWCSFCPWLWPASRCPRPLTHSLTPLPYSIQSRSHFLQPACVFFSTSNPSCPLFFPSIFFLCFFFLMPLYADPNSALTVLSPYSYV